jgi:hypothetical protein
MYTLIVNVVQVMDDWIVHAWAYDTGPGGQRVMVGSTHDTVPCLDSELEADVLTASLGGLQRWLDRAMQEQPR